MLHGVVEGVNVVEDHRCSLSTCVGHGVIKAHGFESSLEGFHKAVIIAVAAAAHALVNREFFKESTKVAAGVLAALIAVMHQANL
ncbi:MAG: hypothetical protein JWL59_128 [Chthoniobacteraceae bacterium]|nr:hypothetical protein [Chthoniobacteraceae bacterium]